MTLQDAGLPRSPSPTCPPPTAPLAGPPAAQRPAERLSYRLAGPLALMLAGAVLASQELGYRAEARGVALRELAIDTRLVVARARRVALQMEAAQRDYLLEGGADERATFNQIATQHGPAVQALHALAERAQRQRDNLFALIQAHTAKATTLTEVMRLAERGARAQALSLLRADSLRDQAGRIDELVEQVIQEEDLAYRESGRERDRIRNLSRAALYSLVLLCLAAVMAALRLLRARERERAQHLQALQSERDKLEGEVVRRTAELTELARHLQTVREDERRHLARELHDELGGLLTAAKLDVARMRKRLQGGTPELVERIGHLGRALDAGIALKRRIVEDLSPSSLVHLGLQRALEILCNEFAGRADLRVTHLIEAVQLDAERELAIYRLVQEALTNIAKYAKARAVHVHLRVEGGTAVASVRDDGIGFDPLQLPAGVHGLAGMRFRVQSCGGVWTLNSTPGAGTTVSAQFALHPEVQSGANEPQR